MYWSRLSIATLFAVVVAFGTACTAAPSTAEDPARATRVADVVRSRFVEAVSAGLTRFTVNEDVAMVAVSREFLAKALAPELFENVVATEFHAIVVEDTPPTRKAQLGFLLQQYANDEASRRAEAAVSRRKGYFAGTPLLTMFRSRRAGRSLFIVYTETVGNDRAGSFVKSIFEQLPTTLFDN